MEFYAPTISEEDNYVQRASKCNSLPYLHKESMELESKFYMCASICQKGTLKGQKQTWETEANKPTRILTGNEDTQKKNLICETLEQYFDKMHPK